MIFFQMFWHIISDDVTSACLSTISSSHFLDRFNDTHLVLIPKKHYVEIMGDLRPISLCNVIYKIVAKVLATWLKQIFPKVVSHNQSAFIPGRLITDNILISYEVLHYLHRKTQGKIGYATMKVDVVKVYDRVEWKFLENVMLKMGFALDWVKLIMVCVTTIRYTVLHDGREFSMVQSRGIGRRLGRYRDVTVAVYRSRIGRYAK